MKFLAGIDLGKLRGIKLILNLNIGNTANINNRQLIVQPRKINTSSKKSKKLLKKTN